MTMIKNYLEESREVQDALLKDETLPKLFAAAVDKIVETFNSGNKVLVAGNGGSAADAQHFAAEFMAKYKLTRKALPAISLTTDTSMITAWSNDIAFDGIFARQIEGLGKKGDVFIGITTSGNSKNILEALAAAKKLGMFTMAFLNQTGGKAKGIADLEFLIPSLNTPRIQEMHTLILHSIAEEVEKLVAA